MAGRDGVVAALAAMPAQPKPSKYDRMIQALAQSWPAEMAKSAYNAVKLPGDVVQGKFNTAPSQPGMWSDEDEARAQLNDREAMNRAVDLAGTVMGGSYAMPAQSNAVGAGIRAYHGSPHDFDKFDVSKIGTGEGAQAFGHGLYFAENEGVARAYRDALAGKQASWRGETIPADVAAEKLGDLLKASNPALTQPYNAAELVSRWIRGGARPDEMERWISGGAWSTKADANLKDELRYAVKVASENMAKPAGRMYEVEINASPEQFLPWDETLAYGGKIHQPELLDRVRSITPADKRQVLEHQVLAGLTGENVYKDILGANVRANTRAITGAMNEAGIPGIKYLDQGSRSAGEGSRNYVVFDDKLIDIIRKYGLAGTAGPLVYGAAQGDGVQ